MTILACSNQVKEEDKFKLSERRLEEDLVIGNGDSEAEIFSKISKIQEDENGNLYFFDKKECKIKVFSESGEFIRVFGGKGNGPGEYQNPVGFEVYSDSILVADAKLRRFSVLDKEGNFLRSIKYEEHQPGDFSQNSKGEMINFQTVFEFGDDYQETPQFIVLDNGFNKIKEISLMKPYENKFKSYLMNVVNFELDSKDRIIASFNIKDKIMIYDNDKEIPVERKLFFKPEEPNIKMQKDGNRVGFTASYAPISFDLSIDENDNFYVLTAKNNFSKESENENEDFYYLIEIFDKNGDIKEIIPVENYGPSLIYVDSKNRILLYDSENAQVIRFKKVY